MNSNNPAASSDSNSLNDRVTAAVHSHRVKMRLLTGTAFLIGFVVVLASLASVIGYSIWILPKQKELHSVARAEVEQAKIDPAANRPVSLKDIKRLNNLLALEIRVNQVVSVGTSVVAVAVGLLGLGTVVLLTLVVLNRRVALRQINDSLAQISNQLRETQRVRDSA